MVVNYEKRRKEEMRRSALAEGRRTGEEKRAERGELERKEGRRRRLTE